MSMNPVTKHLLWITITIIVVILVSIISAYSFLPGIQPLMVMLALVAVISYFGVLSLPGGWKENEGFSEGRVRLAITSALVLVYLVYFSTVIYWKEDNVAKLAGTMIETLTNLLIVVLPFYFGVTGAVEIFKNRSNKNGSSEKNTE